MDQFPEKRPELKSLNDTIDVRPVMDIITQVSQFLMTKAINEGRKQDKYNQTYLGGVSFYLSHNPVNQETRLTFDKHPKTWKAKDIINDMLNMEADMLMHKQSMDAIQDNPFTY